MYTRSNDGLVVLIREIPTLEFWIAPPVQVPAEVQLPPLPDTVKPPLDPVLLRAMPLVGVPALPVTLMLRKVSPLAPMVVLATLSAVPVVEVMVLTMVVLFCVALMVPPPVALKPTPLVVVRLS